MWYWTTCVCDWQVSRGRIFSTELKTATVIPLCKTDDLFAFNNYQLVPLLFIISKVFGKVMYDRQVHFLDFYTLNNSQFGFIKIHWTCMALMTLMNRLMSIQLVYFFNFRPLIPFTMSYCWTNHRTYGISGYLENRKNNLWCTMELHHLQNNQIWCSTGIHAWALLFLIYINDICSVCKYTTPIMFTDDTKLFCCYKRARDFDSRHLARNLLDRRVARIVPMTPGFQVSNCAVLVILWLG